MSVGTYLDRPDGQEREDLDLRLRNPDKPYLVGYGPAEFSTSMALEPWPSIVWDTNLYYRDIGVKVKATRKQIRSRYLEINGESSVRLTMIAEVLLKADRRLLYDLVPLGSHFYDDEIEHAMRQRITEEINKRIAEGERPEDVFDENHDDDIEEQLMNANTQLMINRALRGNSWSHYLWKSDSNDLMLVHAWKRLLIRWMWHYNMAQTISIGLMGETDADVIVQQVGTRTVVFINDQLEPSDVVSCIAVAEMCHHNNT
jgi:hypothetical protein